MIRPAKRAAGWCTIAVACVSGFEGLRTVAYADPVGIPTICFGETKGVRLGDRASVDECRGMLASSLEIANRGVDACVRTYLPDTRRAALVSFTYNIGGQAFCSSTLVRKLNAGDTVGACNELSRWTRAKGIELPGLVGLSVGASGTYKVVADHYRAEAAAQKEADAKAYQVRTVELNDVSAELERAKSEKQIVYRTITKRVETYIDRPIYVRDCADDDGLRDEDAALTRTANPRKPDAVVPGPDADGGKDRR